MNSISRPLLPLLLILISLSFLPAGQAAELKDGNTTFDLLSDGTVKSGGSWTVNETNAIVVTDSAGSSHTFPALWELHKNGVLEALDPGTEGRLILFDIWGQKPSFSLTKENKLAITLHRKSTFSIVLTPEAFELQRASESKAAFDLHVKLVGDKRLIPLKGYFDNSQKTNALVYQWDRDKRHDLVFHGEWKNDPNNAPHDGEIPLIYEYTIGSSTTPLTLEFPASFRPKLKKGQFANAIDLEYEYLPGVKRGFELTSELHLQKDPKKKESKLNLNIRGYQETDKDTKEEVEIVKSSTIRIDAEYEFQQADLKDSTLQVYFAGSSKKDEPDMVIGGSYETYSVEGATGYAISFNYGSGAEDTTDVAVGFRAFDKTKEGDYRFEYETLEGEKRRITISADYVKVGKGKLANDMTIETDSGELIAIKGVFRLEFGSKKKKEESSQP